jgi:NADPH:quinone reductase-like Zn-dependent oxidoreductase
MLIEPSPLSRRGRPLLPGFGAPGRMLSTMKAAVRYSYGGPEQVRIEEIGAPVAGEGRVLVRVHAASVNRADLDYIQPRPALIRAYVGIRRPKNPRLGTDVAGTVEAIGPGVTRFQPGDRVFGDLLPFGMGSFAELVVAREKAFLPIPDGIDFDTAATLPHAAVLALQGLRTRSGRSVKPGDRVLVDGASGNVGPFAIQLAKWMGAEVTGVCRTEKVEFVRSLGADQVIDYRSVDFTTQPQRYDWIVASDAHHPIRAVRRALRPGGQYATLGGDMRDIFDTFIVGPLSSLGSSKKAGLMLWWKPFNAPDVATITDLVLAGHLKPAIDRVYPLDEARDALTRVHEGKARGKVLIRVIPAEA